MNKLAEKQRGIESAFIEVKNMILTESTTALKKL